MKSKKTSSGESHSYFYYALGKNGEPLKNVSVNFTFYHILHTNSVSSTLYTDIEGKINLGSLTDIHQIQSNFNTAYGQCSRNWNIPYLKEMIDYPSTIEVLEDEPIQIPIPSKKLDVTEITLVKFSENGDTISNNHHNLDLNLQDGYGFGDLNIKGLDKGTYKLSIHKLNIDITLIVHEGVYWEADGFVLKKNSIIEVKNEPKYLRINNIKVSKTEEIKGEEESKSTLKFKITNADGNTRAHVFAFTYLPNQPHEEFKNMRQITRSHLDTEVFPFTRWENAYQSNRKLGDEYRYVFNRKNAKRFIGNTLEKPQLIMKRLKVRETNFDTEVIKIGGEYNKLTTEMNYSASKRMACDEYDRRGYGYNQFQNNIDKL